MNALISILALALPAPSLPALPAWIATLIRDLVVKILSGAALELLKPTLAPIGERLRRRLERWISR